MMHAEKGRIHGPAEGVTLSGVRKNTKLHADRTLESPGPFPGAEGAQAGEFPGCNLSGKRTEPSGD